MEFIVSSVSVLLGNSEMTDGKEHNPVKFIRRALKMTGLYERWWGEI